MPDRELVTTRRALHGVAELVLAGPQYRRSGTIALRVTVDGFATTAAPDLRVTGGLLAGPGGTEPIGGHTPRSLAAAVGVEASSLANVYSDGPDVGLDEELVVDEGAARRLANALALGDEALRSLAPDAEPVLWPEHFDVAVTVDEVNYGVSPGDRHIDEPYAYVGPWSVPPADDFWTHPFGAARPMTSFADMAALLAFFTQGRTRLTR
jgi:hypothetical protein